MFILSTSFAAPALGADIGSQADLEAIGANAVGNYYQTADIDLVGFVGGLSSFSGTYNGGNYRISGLDKPLFVSLSGNAVVRNLKLEEVAISVADADSGALAALTEAGSDITVINVRVEGEIEVLGDGQAGGLIGKVEGELTISRSTNSANVSASEGDAGGLIGSATGPVSITKSANSGAVSSVSGDAGGLIGGSSSTVGVINSSNSGEITSIGISSASGGIAGRVEGEVTLTRTDSTNLVEAVNGIAGGLVGVAENDLTVTGGTTGLVSSINGDSGGVAGTVMGVSIVSEVVAAGASSVNGNAGGLFGEVIGDSTVLNSEITGDTSSINGNAGGVVAVASQVVAVDGVKIVGDVSTVNGHVGGLIGQVNQSSSIDNSQVLGNVTAINGNSGGLIGIATESSILNSVEVVGDVNTINGHSGGLIGSAESTVNGTDLSYEGNVSTINGSSGGIVATSTGQVTLSSAESVGTVSTINGDAAGAVASTLAGVSLVGVSTQMTVSSINGAVGGIIGTTATDASIESSYATGSISTINNLAGGVIASSGGNLEIENVYSRGNVSANLDHAGGIVGLVSGSASISNSYSTGDVTTIEANSGGLIGKVNGNSHVTNSFTTGSVTTIKGHAGGLIGDSQQMTTVANSYSTGDVTSNLGDVGGLIGNSGSSIDTGMMMGAVINISDEELIEVNRISTSVDFETTTSIANSYASGNISTLNGSAGGLIGNADSVVNVISSVNVTINQDNNFANQNLGVQYEVQAEAIVNADVSVVITDSYATGSVDTSIGRAGGLVGSANLDLTVNTNAVLSVTSDTTGPMQAIAGVRRQTQSDVLFSVLNSFSTGTVTSAFGEAGGIVGSSKLDSAENYAIETTLVALDAPDSFESSHEIDVFSDKSATVAITNSYTTSTVNAGGIAGAIYGDVEGNDPLINALAISNSYGLGDDDDVLDDLESSAGLSDFAGLDPSTIAATWSENKDWGVCPSINDGLPFLSVFFSKNPCAVSEFFGLPPQIFQGIVTKADVELGPIDPDLANYLIFRNNLPEDLVINKINMRHFPDALVSFTPSKLLQILDLDGLPDSLIIRVPDGRWFILSLATIANGAKTALFPVEFLQIGTFSLYFVNSDSFSFDSDANGILSPNIRRVVSSLEVRISS